MFFFKVAEPVDDIKWGLTVVPNLWLSSKWMNEGICVAWQDWVATLQPALNRGDVGSWVNELLKYKAKHFILAMIAEAKNQGKL